MHLLLTRPEGDAAVMGSQLEALGCRVTRAPLLHMQDLQPDFSLQDAQALVATSRNGLRALARTLHLAAARTLPLIVVGEASACLARELGFTAVVAGDGGARELVPLVRDMLPPGGGTLVYLTGEDVAFDLAAALSPLGYDTRRIVLYRAAAIAELPPDVVAAIRSAALDGAVLMSPRTARIFSRLSLHHGLQDAARGLDYFCISPATARELEALAPARLHVARRPTAEEVLALIRKMASNPARAPLSPGKQR
jgi:uroporphyrinogen-III synthase